MKNKISFSWDLHWSCNFRCPYCWWHGKWDEFEKRNVYPGFEKLTAVWKRIYDLYGECHLEIAGGEPSIYPEFSEFILEILNYHTVSIMTNLSGNLDKIINDKS
jgi:molybdenum cofactor biosynthesis enzyme MoaA